MKRVLSILFVIFLVFAFSLPVFAAVEDEDVDTIGAGESAKLVTVFDPAGIFSESERAELNERIEKINKKYDVNYVILTGSDNGGLSPDDFAFEFLDFYGYDSDGQSAVVFYICFEPGNRCWRTATRNSVHKKFTEVVINDIDDAIEQDMKSGDYYDACITHISYVEKVVSGKYRHIDWGAILMGLAVGVIVGAIVGLMHLSSCRKAMRVVAPVDAHEYLVKDSFNLRNKQVYYLYTTVTKTAKPKSSSSSGGSSYSSSSSGGGSSSGGRSF